MTAKTTLRISRTIALAGLALALLVGATVAEAQSREGKWEFTLGGSYQLGADVEGQEGETFEADDDLGLMMTVGYNFSDRIGSSFGLNWNSVDYEAGNIESGTGGTFDVTGSYESWALSANLLFNLTEEGPLVPFLGAGLGWTWIDTNVPDGPPSTGCWWDPWWGYVCYTDYPTRTTDVLTYQGLAGLRYEFSPTTFLRLIYASKWMDFDNSTSTPRFDVIALDFGWMF